MTIRTEEELQGMQAAGHVVREALEAMRHSVRPGVSTAELDEVAHGVFERNGARSAPKLVYEFPGQTCISVNDEIVHGIPGARVLQSGDLVKLDVTAEKNGFMADAAVTVGVGKVAPESLRLIRCARSAFQEAMKVARVGYRARDIGRVIERSARLQGFSTVRELCGHGIGRTIHESPTVPNFYDPGCRDLLREGMVVAIEPMVTAGSNRSVLDKDGWTVRTQDGSMAAHYEHTVVITRGRPLFLTAA
jgi:methionyl aminopeptidase